MSRSYRFFTEELAQFGDEIVLGGGLEDGILAQLSKVLRVKAGDEVVLIPPTANAGPLAGRNLGGGPFFEFHYEVVSTHKKEAVLKLIEKVENSNELGFGLELVLCLPNKPDKLSFILQKAVELGVSRVILVKGDFSQMKHELRMDRLEKIMKEAAEQSERAYVPELVIEGNLKDYLKGDFGDLLVAMEREDSVGLKDVLEDVSGDVSVLVGPEGGFSDEEKVSVRTHRLKTFTLGKRILRMETAVVVALGIFSSFRKG